MYWVYGIALFVTSGLIFSMNSAQLPDLRHMRTKDAQSRNFSGSQETQAQQENISARMPKKDHQLLLEKPQAAPDVGQIKEDLNRSLDTPPPFLRPRPAPFPPIPPPRVTVSISVPCNGSLSCKNKCQSPRTFLRNETLSCFCDVDCALFKDCCADYNQYCHHGNRSSRRQSNLVNERNKNYWKCYSGGSITQAGINGVWMIGSCPSSWPQDDVLYRCRNLSQTNKITIDNYRYLPVYTSNGRVYHNRFCAQCNGVSPSESTSFELSFSCAVSPPDTLSPNQRLNFLFSYCESNKINWKVPINAPRRYCLDLNVINNRCPDDIKSRCINGSVGVVFISSLQGNYKNIYCAICDNRNQFKCGPQETVPSAGFLPSLQPFSVIFDFKNGERSYSNSYVKVFCPRKHYYDHYLEICRKGYETLPSPSFTQEYQALLWFRFANTGFTNEHPLSKLNLTAPTVSLGNFFQVNSSQIREMDILISSHVMFNLQFNIRISSRERYRYPRSPRQSTVRRMSFEDILKWTSPFDVTLFGKRLTLFKANTKIISCTNLQKYSRSEYTVLQDTPSVVSIKASGEVLKAKEHYIGGKTANESQDILVCRPQQPVSTNCSGVYVLMKEGEFRVLINKSIFVSASKQVYDRSEYIWINKSVLVCRNFSKHYYTIQTSSKLDDKALKVLTAVCLSLSIIGLVFVLVTYSLFSELRTPPGINLMNLSVSILLAQLLWLLGSGQTDTPMACTVIAVILHYLFLVSFMWTSIIAFDTWRAFTAKGRRLLPDSRQERIKHCLRHMAVGWLPVMVYVAICVALDLTNTVNIGYMSKTACWISNKWAILYFFAIPVALFLIFNVVFYVLTLRAIRATSAQARTASDHDRKQNFGIYVRIATLMGFPWAFGFVAPFGLGYLWYPFIVVNGLQGVYIAFAFALNKRARGLYKNRFWCMRESNAVGTTLDSKSTNKSSVPFATLLRNQYFDTKL